MADKSRLFFLRSVQQVLRCVYSRRSVASVNQIYSTKPPLPPNSLAWTYKISRTCSTYTSGNVTLNKTMYLQMSFFKSLFLLSCRSKQFFTEKPHMWRTVLHSCRQRSYFMWLDSVLEVCMAACFHHRIKKQR